MADPIRSYTDSALVRTERNVLRGFLAGLASQVPSRATLAETAAPDGTPRRMSIEVTDQWLLALHRLLDDIP